MQKGFAPLPFYLFCFFSAFWDFFLILLRGVLFACSMAPTGVFLGFHSFSRVLNVFWVFSLLCTGFLVLNDFVLFLPFLDVFPATCIHVITSGMDGSVLFAVVFIVHPLC